MNTVGQQLDAFFSKYPSETFFKGEYLVHAGSVPKGVFYLASGVVRQMVVSKKGEEFALNLFQPPSFVPLTWAIENIPNEYDLIAFSTVHAFIAPREDVITFLHANPEVLFDLTRRLLRGMNGLLQKNGHFMHKNARARVVAILLQLHERGIDVELTHRELATLTGLSREAVSKEIERLVDELEIIDAHQHIKVLDPQRLESLLL